MSPCRWSPASSTSRRAGGSPGVGLAFATAAWLLYSPTLEGDRIERQGGTLRYVYTVEDMRGVEVVLRDSATGLVARVQAAVGEDSFGFGAALPHATSSYRTGCISIETPQGDALDYGCAEMQVDIDPQLRRASIVGVVPGGLGSLRAAVQVQGGRLLPPHLEGETMVRTGTAAVQVDAAVGLVAGVTDPADENQVRLFRRHAATTVAQDRAQDPPRGVPFQFSCCENNIRLVGWKYRGASYVASSIAGEERVVQIELVITYHVTCSAERDEKCLVLFETSHTHGRHPEAPHGHPHQGADGEPAAESMGGTGYHLYWCDGARHAAGFRIVWEGRWSDLTKEASGQIDFEFRVPRAPGNVKKGDSQMDKGYRFSASVTAPVTQSGERPAAVQFRNPSLTPLP